MSSRPPKRRRVSPSRAGRGEDGAAPAAGVGKSFLRNAANWSLEENYAARSKKRSKKAAKAERASDRLPVRTADGLMRPAAPDPTDTRDDGDADSLGSDGDDGKDDETDADGDGKGQGGRGKAAVAPARAPKPQLSEAEQVRAAKAELAKIALKLNENPEEHAGAFKTLAQVGQQYSSVTVQKMCLATQLAVYKDVIPGYRIRALGDDAAAPGEKLSSDVRRLRAYEQSLLAGYQGYLKELMRLSKLRPASAGAKRTRASSSSSSSSSSSLADAALTCACALLTAVPHFNFREELLRILVGKLSTRRVDASFVRCRAALETLFRDDDEGRPSMEAVAMLAKMMKARDYGVDESVPNTFLHLRLLSEFAGKGSQDAVERPAGVKKKERAFRTKRARKTMKEQKALERDMAQADALVAHEERDRMQSETLKLVFATYFRILKLRTPHLMGAVLEGLAKYAHLINQDFFGDLLEALKDLIRHSEDDAARAAKAGGQTAGGQTADGGDEDEAGDESGDDGDDDGDDTGDFNVARNPSREALLCTVTAYALLAGQDAHNARNDLHLDLSFFTTNLFRSLQPLALSADIEKRANSLQQRLADAQAAPSSPSAAAGTKVNLQTTTVLLVRSLTAVLLPNYNIRSVPPLRLAAFAKQVMSASLHVPEKSCQALLALLHDVANTHGKKISALWNTEERRGDGAFNPLSETVEGSNPFATTVWEGELLRKHYCPSVREGVRALEKNLAV